MYCLCVTGGTRDIGSALTRMCCFCVTGGTRDIGSALTRMCCFCVTGGTRDIGSALTRMCMRHRSIEAKLRDFSMAFMDCMINPLQDQMEEWKRGTNTLDKDHAKEYKKVRSEIKKKSLDTLKLQKKAKKADALGKSVTDWWSVC
ncbi:protein MTSS 1-like [Salvelinus alpinus]